MSTYSDKQQKNIYNIIDTGLYHQVTKGTNINIQPCVATVVTSSRPYETPSENCWLLEVGVSHTGNWRLVSGEGLSRIGRLSQSVTSSLYKSPTHHAASPGLEVVHGPRHRSVPATSAKVYCTHNTLRTRGVSNDGALRRLVFNSDEGRRDPSIVFKQEDVVRVVETALRASHNPTLAKFRDNPTAKSQRAEFVSLMSTIY
ncbi:hypothetical protein J6590_013977 [Homalodisca vitripennis]|nr:hypothetical protein J6590_013977 [Homalodisca vitripennis]